MKLAILIAGYSRTLEHNIESIKNNLIQDHHSDIFIHFTTDEKENDKYWNKEISLKVIKDKLSPKVIIFEKDKIFENNKSIRNHWYKFYKLNEIRKTFSRDYDIVIKLRPDTYFHEKINFSLDKETLFLPKDTKVDMKKLENDNHLCDIFAYGSEKIMNDYFSIYESLNSIIQTKITNPENIMFEHLKLKRIIFKEIDINYSIILSLCKTISITGDSGSGKTTLSKIIKENLDNSFILECDRYHKWERGNKNWEKMTHLNPDANYLAKMEKDVFDLKIGNKIYQVDYDHEIGKFTDKEEIESNENIIVCGLHTNYNSTKYNISIFIDTDEELKKKWKIERDTKKRGYTKEKILKQMESRADDYEKFILPQINSCDIIVKNRIEKEKIITKLGISCKLNYQLKNLEAILKDNYFWYDIEDMNIVSNLIKELL